MGEQPTTAEACALAVYLGGRVCGIFGQGGTIHWGAWERGALEGEPHCGRVAFWTDDETCKVNVNTASEGVYWDMPRASTKEDLAMEIYQPKAGEYQRFPGHPATVCLSSVLFPTGGGPPPAPIRILPAA